MRSQVHEFLKDGTLLISGLLWTLAYIEMIRTGFARRGYAMPVVALALNLTWELLYTIVGFFHWPNIQAPINAVWLGLDIVILFTLWKFGRPPEIPAQMRSKCWYFSLLLAGALVLQVAFLAQFGIRSGATYSAFLQNIAMSTMFVLAAVAGSPLLQTVRIASLRLTGTLFATLAFGVFRGVWFALVVGLVCLVVDSICVGIVRVRVAAQVATNVT
jgi:hypothetical protein